MVGRSGGHDGRRSSRSVRTPVRELGLERAAAHVPRLLLDWSRDHGTARHASVAGTTVFADISGFTKLSERLARQGGKAGAEQVSDVVSAAFDGLLTEVAAHGGEMLKFGGDAVLLLFRGDRHATRAAAACIGMQDAITQFALPDLPGRPLRLRISIGAHSGTFDIFMVGDRHRDLVIAGPETTVTVGLETAANAGQVLVSSALAAQLEGGSVRPTSAGTHLLLRRAPEVQPVGSQPRTDTREALDCIPVGYRAHLVDGRIEPSHRLATVAFVHVDGIDATLARNGGARAAEALQHTYVTIEQALDRYGVCLLASDVYGDGAKVIAVAGAPEAVEEPERRMLCALRAVLDEDLPLTVRAGVHRGHLFAGEVGPSFRRTYTVIGDVVNTAARLAAHAMPTELLVLRDTLDAAGAGIDAEERPPFAAKGKTVPLLPHLVRRIDEHRTAASSPTSEQVMRFVGREDELQTLHEAISSLDRDRGVAIGIAGETGIGKTRLVEESLRTGELPVLRVQCEPYERHTPWFPIRHLIAGALQQQGRSRADVLAAASELAQIARPELVPWLPLVATVLDAPAGDTPETAALDDRFRRPRTIAIVMELLALALPERIALFIDDIHFADEASVDLLAELAGAASDRPWLLVLTSREGASALPVPESNVITLGPLTDDAVDGLLQDTTIDPPLTPIDRRLLVERAAGVPLFVAGLLTAGQRGEGSIPSSVEGVLALGIDRFTRDERHVLRSAAVLGTSFQPSLLDAVLSGTGLDHRLVNRSALHSELQLESNDRVRFRHQLLRDVTYEGTPYRERKQLHERAADALVAQMGDEPDDRVGVLAIHLECAGQLDGVWHYARAAAEQAARRDAYDIAVDFLERAAAAARRLGIRGLALARVYEDLGEAAAFNDASSRADLAYRRARQHAADDPVLFARLCRKQARSSERSASWASMRRWISRGLQAIDGLADPAAAAERASLLVIRAWMQRNEGRPRQAEATARRALAVAQAAGASATEAAAYLELDRSLVQLGRHDEATHGPAALDLLTADAQRAERAVALNAMGLQAQRQGHWDEARSLFERAREEMRAAGNLADSGVVEFNIAEILCDQGRTDEADEVLDDLARLWRSVRHPIGAHWVSGLRGRVLLRRGAPELARALLEEACASLHERGMAPHAALFEPARIECAIALGDVDLAHQCLDALAGGGLVAETTLTRLRAWSALVSGQLDQAEAGSVEALQLARQAGDPFELARCLQLSAHLDTLSDRPTTASPELREISNRLGLVDLPGAPIPAA